MMPNEQQPMVDLPDLAAVFEALRRGRHICMTDGALYRALKAHVANFTALFAQLGFELAHHPRDFFYFVDHGNFTDLSARMAVFMFILIENLSDRGDPVEETVMSRHFRPADLPHLTKERYRQLMQEAGMPEPEDIDRLLQTLERFGFVDRAEDTSFTFRPPAYRFLDLCLEIATQAPTADAEDGAATEHSAIEETDEN